MVQEELFPRERPEWKPEDNVSIRVEIMGQSLRSISKKGKPFISMAARDMGDSDRGTFKLLAFGQAFTGACACKVGDKVFVTGSWTKDDDKTFIAFNLSAHGMRPAKTKTARIIEQYGSLEAYEEANVRWTRDMKGKGFVQVKRDDHYSWLPSSECIWDGFFWRTKIDYLMDVLTPAVVNAELREVVGGGLNVTAPHGLTNIRASWVPKYKEWVEARLESLNPKEELFP